ERQLASLFGNGGVEIGPIPAGIPVNLLANLNPLSESADPAERLAHDKTGLGIVIQAKRDPQALPRAASDEQAKKVFANLIDPLLKLSKCPDFVVSRGHYFGTGYIKEGEPGLSDADKRSLIEYMKTF